VLRDSEGTAFKVKYEDYNVFGDTGATVVAVDGAESDDEEYVKTAAFLHADGGKDSVAKLLGSIGAKRKPKPAPELVAADLTVVQEIRAGTDGISTSSREVALGSQDLSQRTESSASIAPKFSFELSSFG
jgi:hypothetical protein